MVEPGAELNRGDSTSSELARWFPTPMLSSVGDEIADGLWLDAPDESRPLALFDGPRVDYSLRRLVHYTGSDWRGIPAVDPAHQYHRYVDQFVRVGPSALAGSPDRYERLILPAASWSRRARRRGRPGRAHRRLALAPLPDAGPYHLAPATGRGTTWSTSASAPQRQDDHRQPRGAAAALLADGRALRRPAPVADHRRLRPRPRLLRRDRILDELVPTTCDPGARRGPGRAPGRRAPRSPASAPRRSSAACAPGRSSPTTTALGAALVAGAAADQPVAGRSASTWRAARSRRRATGAGALRQRCCASPTSRCTADQAAGCRQRVLRGGRSGEHLLIGLATLDALRRDRSGLHSRKLRSFDERRSADAAIASEPVSGLRVIPMFVTKIRCITASFWSYRGSAEAF